MCGICGKISLNNNADIGENLIRKMCSVLKHRGPDDEGVYVKKLQITNYKLQIGLGHRRLSIIDLSEAGHQPMSNEDGTIWIVMNGEIYNFLELKEDLKKQGHYFKSRTDTEVILHLYEEKGADCLKYMRGAFAFAIWDEKKEHLFMAKDRIGKKPLYYIYKNQTLIFASEIKALLQDPEVNVEVNRRSITDYLSYGYTPTPETTFKDIMKLPPAHFMLYKNGIIKIERYWNLDFSKKIEISEEECSYKIMDLLEDATRIRLISDVPLGAFLSGGIDSSAVVYMMSKINYSPVKTFSIGFGEKSYNELRYAKIIADYFQTDHQEYIVEPRAIELLPKLVWHYNEPYADSSALPSYYVAKMARQEVKVALNGDGGDENFGGYERFMAARFAEIFRKIPNTLKNSILKATMAAVLEPFEPKAFRAKLKRFISVAQEPYRQRHYDWVTIFKDSEKDSLFTDEFKKETAGKNSFFYLNGAFNECNVKDVVDCVIAADIKTNLLDDLLVKMDIATMANSLEGRSPFLDHKMMEFAASLSSKMKIKGITLKYILKKTLSEVLPKEVLLRKKMGFAIPLDKWFRKELKKYSYQILLSSECLRRNYFKKESIKKLLDGHASGNANNGVRIWSLLNLELWHRIFIDKNGV